jgi:hypothetical protein
LRCAAALACVTARARIKRSYFAHHTFFSQQYSPQSVPT